MITPSELEDLTLADLDDEFIKANINSKTFNAELSHDIIQGVCDNFVQNFFTNNELATLHQLLQHCDTSLSDIENILRRFIINLETIQQDIGDVRERLKKIGVQLLNVKNVEIFVWEIVSRYVIPPEVVRVISQSNDEELGPQFKLSAKHLLKLLQHRKDDESSQHLLLGNEKSISIVNCPLYWEQMEIFDRLTVHACVKMKRFISKKLILLTVKNTNVWIQQEHILRPHAFYVHFLRTAAPLLQHSQSNNKESEIESPEILPFLITKTLYDELRREYCDIMSQLYLQRIRHYVMTLNAMESSTNITHKISLETYVLPLLTDTRENIPYSIFSLSERSKILENILAPPLVPAVELAKRRRHFYEETFRSMNILLCDAVTHEFLFTYTFFSGDMSVFIDVFKPTIQFIIDYVAEVMLDQGEGSVRRLLRDAYSHASVNLNCKNDCYGLLILIRLCHDFRSLMKNVRRLSCLEGFYDSLLLLLWPAFQKTFERQMLAMRCVDIRILSKSLVMPTSLLSSSYNNNNNNNTKSQDWVMMIHPLAKRYAEFTSALVSISYGCGFDSLNEEENVKSETSIHSNSVVSINFEEGNNNNNNNKISVKRKITIEKNYDKNKNNNNNNNIECEIDFAELQKLAWNVIERERASDAADSASRFAVLAGNLSFLRVEIIRILQEMGFYLSSSNKKNNLNSTAFLLNNIYAILSIWRNNAVVGALGEDYKALEELQKIYRESFVEEIVWSHFPSLQLILYNNSNNNNDNDNLIEQNPQFVLSAADNFINCWRNELDSACMKVRSVLGDSNLVSETLAQLCMEVLICNARFHACISTAFVTLEEEKEKEEEEKKNSIKSKIQRPMRSYIITNQQMLQHMRTLANIPNDDDKDDSDNNYENSFSYGDGSISDNHTL